MFFSEQPGTGLKSFLIANNTFVDSTDTGLEIRSGDHENSRIENNIISGNGTVAAVVDDSGLYFSHNLWSKAPPAAASGDGDVIGDPRLAKSGSTGPGLLESDWFKLSPGSPAMDAGTSLSEVPNDFDRVSRPRGPAYDIGAFESLYSTHVADLRVVSVVSDSSSLTLTLRWTAPADAATYSLRRSDTRLTEASWGGATIVPVPFTPSPPGSTEELTTRVSNNGDTLYLALKSQNSQGVWSELSNNAFWPSKSVYLPLIMNSEGLSSSVIDWTHRPQEFGPIRQGHADKTEPLSYKSNQAQTSAGWSAKEKRELPRDRV